MKTRLSRDNKSEVLRSSLSFGMFFFISGHQKRGRYQCTNNGNERDRDSKEWMETLKLLITKSFML